MKAPNFRYARPTTLAAALDILASQSDAMVLAGGQSLLAMLNLRLIAPLLLVDIGALGDLRGITLRDGIVEIGAGTCHRAVLDSALIARHLPLLAKAMQHVAHPAVRNRGTIGGSLALADPAAEWPACVTALGGSIVLASVSGQREVSADNFFVGLMDTSLRPGELLVSVRLPVQSNGSHWGFHELSRRHGDFALAGLAATSPAPDAPPDAIRLAYFGCTSHARLATKISALLGATDGIMPDPAELDTILADELGEFSAPGCRADTTRRLAAAVTHQVVSQLRGGSR
jgi:carbon-monoxide dehydrogenase medium subunit